jgi:hypothetical protein
MRLVGFVSATGRRSWVSLGLAAILIAGSVTFAEQAAAPAQQADSFLFKTDTAMITWQVRADKTADFESAWQAIRAKALANAKPELKALGESIKIYKPDAAPQEIPNVGKVVLYYFILDPVSKGISYDPSILLFGEGVGLFERTEAEPVFNKLKESIVGIGPQSAMKIQ